MDNTSSSARASRIAEITLAYLQAEDAGQAPDRQELLARHPDLTPELESFFADHDRAKQMVKPPGPELAETLAVVASPAPPAPLETVRYFGDYELLQEIARGGMGVVYKARQTTLHRIVALKMILAGNLASAEDVQRFRSEARTAANLRHPNIVTIYEVGEHQGQHYFSMDYIAGRSLADIVRESPLPAARAARYVQTIAEAIHYAHQQGIVHRDLKPSNVLIDGQDQPKVTDFGLAKQLTGDAGLTATGQLLGTPSYMAPEQASGKAHTMGPAGDIYSLGAILYELLVGRPPFKAETVFDTLQQVRESDPVPPRLLNSKTPADLETICLKCLEKDPGKRYQSSQELANDLGRFLSNEPIKARPPSIPYLVRTLFQKQLQTMVLTVLIGLATGFLWSATLILLLNPPWYSTQFDSYDYYSSLSAPWTPSKGPVVSESFGWILLLLGWFLVLFSGYLAVLLVRPRNQAGAMAVGAAAGLVSGLTIFTLFLGPALVVQTAVSPCIRDLALVDAAREADAARPGEGGRLLVKTYPELEDVPPEKRATAVSKKTAVDLYTRSPHGIWLGMLFLLAWVAFQLGLATEAGFLVRYHAEHPWTGLGWLSGAQRERQRRLLTEPFWYVHILLQLTLLLTCFFVPLGAALHLYFGVAVVKVIDFAVLLFWVRLSIAFGAKAQQLRDEHQWPEDRWMDMSRQAALVVALSRVLLDAKDWSDYLPRYVDVMVYVATVALAIRYFSGARRAET